MRFALTMSSRGGASLHPLADPLMMTADRGEQAGVRAQSALALCHGRANVAAPTSAVLMTTSGLRGHGVGSPRGFCRISVCARLLPPPPHPPSACMQVRKQTREVARHQEGVVMARAPGCRAQALGTSRAPLMCAVPDKHRIRQASHLGPGNLVLGGGAGQGEGAIMTACSSCSHCPPRTLTKHACNHRSADSLGASQRQRNGERGSRERGRSTLLPPFLPLCRLILSPCPHTTQPKKMRLGPL